jgi:ribosome-associated heat shock protein Hsp15
MLYAETADSLAQREKNQAERKALNQSMPQTIRPNKKQRRQIHQFLDQ